MALIFRTSNTANAGTSYIKSSPLTYTEGDGNLAWLATNMSGSIVSITGSSSIQGSLTVSAGITGSLFGTSSWAQNAASSSYPIAVTGNNSLHSTKPRAGVPSVTNANVIFLGTDAGSGSVFAQSSNFFGNSAGRDMATTLVQGSNNFFGGESGRYADKVSNSNFFGLQSGYSAINSEQSNFFGRNTGYQALSASYSTLIGFQVGKNEFLGSSGNGVGKNNIIIGTNITLEDDRQSSINIGGVLFGTGSYFNTASSPFSGSANGRIGINVVSPNHTLDVSGSINASSTIYANNLAGIVFNTASVGDVRLIGDNDGTGLDGGDYFLRTGLAYYGNVITDNYLANQGTLSGSFAWVGIGTTSPSYKLEVSTDSAAKPSTNTWTITSDSRVKENVQPYTKGLDIINQINPVTYDYNGKAGFQKIKGNVGVIAQDVKDVLPESISTYFKKLNETDTSETELYNFNSHALTYVLINAIKELKAEIDLLKAQM